MKRRGDTEVQSQGQVCQGLKGCLVMKQRGDTEAQSQGHVCQGFKGCLVMKQRGDTEAQSQGQVCQGLKGHRGSESRTGMSGVQGLFGHEATW